MTGSGDDRDKIGRARPLTLEGAAQAFTEALQIGPRRTSHEGWDVSYRQHWWSRRLYACVNVERQEAEPLAAFMHRQGYRRVRMERSF